MNLKLPLEIVTYGYGDGYRRFKKRTKCRIKFVIDQKNFHDTEEIVCSFDDVNDWNNIFVVITMMNPIYVKEARKNLERNGLKHYENYMLWGEFLAFENSEYYLDKCSKQMPIFSQVAIETINRCNNTCSFCPSNRYSDKRKTITMERTLFEKIINELHEMNYGGLLSLTLNNEPFLDARLPELLRYARENCPNAYIEIYTNTTLLSIDIFKSVIDNLNRIVLDNYYAGEPVWNSNVQAIYDYIKDKDELKRKVVFSMRNQDEILTSRGGLAPNKQNVKYDVPPIACSRIFWEMVIRPDGKLGLCCADAQETWELGDVSENTLEEIWYSEKYKYVRNKMLNEGRGNISLCKDCDVVYDGAHFDAYLNNDNIYVWEHICNDFEEQYKDDSLEQYLKYVDRC